jgi:hypothetical protein
MGTLSKSRDSRTDEEMKAVFIKLRQIVMKRFGWKPLTADVKRNIFGLNAARVYAVDPEAKRNPVPDDYLEKLRRMYKQSSASAPSNTQYGWVRADSTAASKTGGRRL